MRKGQLVYELEHNPADEPISLPRWVRQPTPGVHLWVTTSFVVIWYIVEFLSQQFLTTGKVSGWYPSAGLGVALLWALGLRYAWVIVPAAMFTGMAVWQFDVLPAVATALVKAGAYAGTAIVLRGLLRVGELPTRPTQIGGMIGGLIGCAGATAGVCVGILVAMGEVPASDAGAAIFSWAIGDAVGLLLTVPLLVLVVGPTLVVISNRPTDEAGTGYLRAVGVFEVLAGWRPSVLIGATAVSLAVLMCLGDRPDPRVYYLGFVLLPALSMRYRLAGGLSGLLLLNVVGVTAVRLIGIDRPTLEDLQLISLALAISTILVGAFAVMRSQVEARRQTEHRWATMALEGSNLGRWSLDLATNRLRTDYLLTDSFGYRRDRVGDTVSWWEQRIHPEDVKRNREALLQLLAGQVENYEAENRMMAADGSWGWFVSRGTVIHRDASGRPTRVAGTHQDITERKELDRIRADAEATRRSEQRFRTLADGAPVAIFQTDAKGVLLYVNPAWCAMTGRRQSDALYRSAADVAHANDIDDVGAHWSRAIASAGPVAIEFRAVTPAGQVRWLKTQATPMRHAGVLLGYVGTAVDVTPDRRAMAMIRDSEARYRTLADHAYDMLWRVDAEGRFTYVSPSVTKLMGYSPDEMIGSDAFDYFHPDDLARVRQKHAVLSLENPEFEDVHRYRRKDGSYIVFEAVGRLIVSINDESKGELDQPTDDDSVTGQTHITGISRDVTQRVESERIQRELEEQLARAQKLDAIGTFATGIAHDFRNSLLAIKASAQTVNRKLDPDHPAQPALATVNDACAQAMQVTQSLLTFARGPGSTKRTIDLAKLVSDNTRLLCTLLPPGVELRCDCPDTPLNINANEGELQQAIMNLVLNASDACTDRPARNQNTAVDPGTIRITLTHQSGRNLARLVVADNGCGMSPEVLDRALEPFYTTKARLKGTGLGLSQVHGIVTSHGGDLAIVSTPDQGTVVTLTFPLAVTPTSATDLTHATPATHPINTSEHAAS